MNPPSRPPRLAKISELARLAGVPAPTIKHYMREGLLPPPVHRTSRNMAWYDAALAERVRVIKELQQRHFLPLRIIGDILEPAPSASIRGDLHEAVREQLVSLESAVRAGHRQSRRAQWAPNIGSRSRAEVLASLRVTERDLDRLTELGLIEPEAGPNGEAMYAGADLDILEVIHDTRDAGLGHLFGMDVLGPYLDAVRKIARFELDMFRARVSTDSSQTQATRAVIAQQAVALGGRLLVAMRNKLIIEELRGLADRTSGLPAPHANNTKPDRRRTRPRRQGE